MKLRTLHLLLLFALALTGCDDSTPPIKPDHSSELSREESAALAILTHYATNLIGQENFPDLDPYEPSPEGAIFRNILRDVCPNVMDAEVEIGRYAYSIGSQPVSLVAGDRTNKVNLRTVRALGTPGVVRHSEIEYDYTTLDGESGSIPATYLLVERVIEGRKVHLMLSTKKPNKSEQATPRKPYD